MRKVVKNLSENLSSHTTNSFNKISGLKFRPDRQISMALKCLKLIFKWASKYWALNLDNGFLSVGHTTEQGHLELKLEMRWPISMDSVQIN